MLIEPTRRFVKAKGILAQDLIDGDVLLLHVDSGRHFGLDRVGNEAWKVFSAGATLNEACDQLLSRFDVAREQLVADLAALIEDLTANGLLELADQ